MPFNLFFKIGIAILQSILEYQYDESRFVANFAGFGQYEISGYQARPYAYQY